MLFTDFITWWYGRGWQTVARNSGRRLSHVLDIFSVQLLLRTLLAPWRRIITYPGASFDAKLKAMGDNLFSRVVGLVIRIVVLISAAVVGVAFAVYGLVTILAWPLIPLAVPVTLVLGLTR